MITRISHTKLFFPAVSALLFVCTCFFCSCYSTDIIKPDPEKITDESMEDIQTIALKNGSKIPAENKQIELNYDWQLKKLVLAYNISADTIRVNENTIKISNKTKSISLDSIQYIKYHKLNGGLTTLAVIGGIAGILAIILVIVAVIELSKPWGPITIQIDH